MAKVMTKAEIYAEFKSEWVLLEDPVIENYEVKAGKVLWHSENRDEVYGKAIELRPRNSAFLYTGKTPEGTVAVI